MPVVLSLKACCHSDSLKWYHYFSLHLLVASEFGHVYKCFLAVCIFYLVNFHLYILKIKVFFFLIYSYLYIFRGTYFVTYYRPNCFQSVKLYWLFSVLQKLAKGCFSAYYHVVSFQRSICGLLQLALYFLEMVYQNIYILSHV